MTITDREDPAAFPYFETHNFEGWIRQFRTLAESTGDSALAFDPIPSVPVDDDGDPIPLNGAAQWDQQTQITRWRAADRALKGLQASACRKNPTTKSMFQSCTWDTAADCYNALIARYRLQEDSFKAATFTDLFTFDPANDNLHDLLDRFDVKILTLNNVGEVISDAMKVKLLKRALASSKNALHVRVSDALKLSVNVLDYARLCKNNS